MNSPTEYAELKAAACITLARAKNADGKADADKIEITCARFDPLTGKPADPVTVTRSLSELVQARAWTVAEVARIDVMIADFKAAK